MAKTSSRAYPPDLESLWCTRLCRSAQKASCATVHHHSTRLQSVVVMSPLLSLMYDQVAKLIAKGVKAVCISGEKPSDAFADTVEGRVNHVFGSPESFIGNTSCLPCLLMFAFLDKWWPWPLMKLTALLNGKSMNTHELLLQALVY